MLNAYAQELSNELSTFVENRIRQMMVTVVLHTELSVEWDIAMDGLFLNPSQAKAKKAVERVYGWAEAKADFLLS